MVRRRTSAPALSYQVIAALSSLWFCSATIADASSTLNAATLSLEPAVSTASDKSAYLDPDAPKPWTAQIEPMVWYVAASGKVRLPVTSGTGPGGFTTDGDKVNLKTLNLDEPELRPAGAAHISADLWRFTFSGTDASASDDGLVASDTFRIGAVDISPGDTLDVDFELGTYELTIGYEVWSHDFQKHSEHPENAVPVVLRLWALGGGRVYDVEFDVRRTSGAFAQADSSEFFIEPILGARLEADFTKAFGIDVQFSVGGQPFGDHTSYSVDVAAGFHYRPFENFGLQIGYRQLAYWLADGDGLNEFEYDGRLAGLYFGVTVRF